MGSYYFPLISLVMRIIDDPSIMKDNPMLKASDDTRFLSIIKTPMRITTTFKTIIPKKIDFMINRTAFVDLKLTTLPSFFS